MFVVYKYFLQSNKIKPLEGETKVWTATLPLYANVVRLGVSGGKPALWAIVDTEREQGYADAHYVILGTGQEIPKDVSYVSSIDNAPFVWHFFKLRDIKDTE